MVGSTDCDTVQPANYQYLHSLRVIEVLYVELYAQVYAPPSVVRKWEIMRIFVVEESLVTNTLDEASVLVMLTEPFFHWAAAVLQERTSDWPTVAWWLRSLTSSPPMVTTGPAALHLVTKSWERGRSSDLSCSIDMWDTNLLMLITSQQDVMHEAV